MELKGFPEGEVGFTGKLTGKWEGVGIETGNVGMSVKWRLYVDENGNIAAELEVNTGPETLRGKQSTTTNAENYFRIEEKLKKAMEAIQWALAQMYATYHKVAGGSYSGTSSMASDLERWFAEQAALTYRSVDTSSAGIPTVVD